MRCGMNRQGRETMTFRALVMACCVFALAAPALAQSGAAKSDSITGAWTGEFVMEGAPKPMPVQFQLKLDGKGVVTGTFTGLPNPGEVKKGTYDAKTRALRLELGVAGEETVRLVLEGTVDKDVARGRLTGERSGEFRLAKER